jgi:hypothetical protein
MSSVAKAFAAAALAAIPHVVKATDKPVLGLPISQLTQDLDLKTSCNTLKVSPLPFSPQEDTSQGFAKIQTMTSSVLSVSPQGGHGVGATRAALVARHSLTRDDRGCLHLELEVGYTPVVSYVARELQNNECAANHVLEHERHHVQIYRDALLTLPQRVESKLRPLFNQVLESADSENGIRQLKEFALDEAATTQPLHQAFDSDEEYEKNTTACGGAVYSIYRRWLKRETGR